MANYADECLQSRHAIPNETGPIFINKGYAFFNATIMHTGFNV